MQTPRQVYTELLEDRRRDVAFREQRHAALGYARLGVVLAGLAIVWAALATHGLSIAWAAVPAGAFVGLMIWHERLLSGLELHRRAVRFFEGALARLDGHWAGNGSTGESYLDAAHPYAQDLDLFGKGSLFELLCTARTHIGEETLARWLLHPAGPETVRARQQAVEELRPRVDLREDLAVLAEEARTGIDPVSLAAWGETPVLLEPGVRIRIWGFTILGIAAAAGRGRLAAARLFLARLAGEPSVSPPDRSTSSAGGRRRGRSGARIKACLRRPGASRTRTVSVPPAGPAARFAPDRRRAPVPPPRAPAALDGVPGFARQPLCPLRRILHFVDTARRH